MISKCVCVFIKIDDQQVCVCVCVYKNKSSAILCVFVFIKINHQQVCVCVCVFICLCVYLSMDVSIVYKNKLSSSYVCVCLFVSMYLSYQYDNLSSTFFTNKRLLFITRYFNPCSTSSHGNTIAPSSRGVFTRTTTFYQNCFFTISPAQLFSFSKSNPAAKFTFLR